MRWLLMMFLLLLGVGSVSAQSSTAPQITRFTSEFTAVNRDELRSGAVQMFVNWSVINRPMTTTLVFEQVFPNGRVVNIELPRPFPWVNSSGNGIVALIYPSDNQITDTLFVRLRVVNIFTQQTITQRELTIAVIDTSQPQISNFGSDNTVVITEELLNGSSRVRVNWDVLNRTPEMNLAFEQVLPDGSVVNVELPRPDIWVNSAGSGDVAPVNGDAGATSVELRVRLYVVATNETIAMRTLFLPIQNRPLAPTSTPTPRPSLTIRRFDVTPNRATGGDTLTVNWDVSGLDEVRVYLTYTGMNDNVVPPTYTNDGSVTLVAPEGVRSVGVALDDTNTNRLAEITVPLSCSVEWFAPSNEHCPSAPPQTIQAAYQPFEGGYMVWRQDTELIVIYFADTNSFMLRPDTYTEGDITFPEAPPEGLLQPINGFGKVWVEEESLRDRLGWALSVEQGYAMTYQETPWGLGTRITRFRMFTLPDGTVISDMIDEF